jgi:hypothetical protein
MKLHLACPYIRSPAKRSFESLIDTEAQKKWLDSNYKHSFWDSLEYYVFDYLLNIEFILDKPHKTIGQSMYDEEEADTISKYLNFYNDSFEAEMPDSYYVNHPKWPAVLEGARRIIKMMEKNNKKYDLERDMEIWYEMYPPGLD